MATQLGFAAAAFLLVAVLLLDIPAQARQCPEPCEENERCARIHTRSTHQRARNACIPINCLTRPRRGRCSGTPIYHFDHATMRCYQDHSGSCYGPNRFLSLEDCELSCIPWYRR